jgi:hypothetical protein
MTVQTLNTLYCLVAMVGVVLLFGGWGNSGGTPA